MSTKTSPEPGDLRVRRTRKLLWDALMAELAARAFGEITVRDICERAMVHRTTFYKHYADKDALLEQGMRQMYDALVADEEHRPPAAYTLEDPPPYFVRLFEQAAQHPQFYRLMVCGDGVGRFQKEIKEYLVAAVETKARAWSLATRQMPDMPLLDVPLAIHAHVMAGAALSLLAWWLEHDMSPPPRRMAQYLMSPHGVLPGST